MGLQRGARVQWSHTRNQFSRCAMRLALGVPLLLLAASAAHAAFDFEQWSSAAAKSKAGALLVKTNSTRGNATRGFGGRLSRMRKRLRAQLQNVTSEEKAAFAAAVKRLKNHTRDHVSAAGDSLAEINEKLNVTGNFYQGDMLLTDEQFDALHPEDAGDDAASAGASRARRQAINTAGYGGGALWSTLYYSFDANTPESTRKVMRAAAKIWNDNTCVDVVETTTATPRVHVIYGSGCYSYIGVIATSNGVQELSLGPGCEHVGIAAHEIGHALGFFHEQSRHDRDLSIGINAANVQSGWLDQFGKETTHTNNNFDLPYDYGSIMHYAGNSVSSNGLPTMVAWKPEWQDTMGSHFVSFRDIMTMNKLYNCKARCNATCDTQVACKNGGIVNPRNCDACLCPAGYAGAFCDQLPATHSMHLNATSEPHGLGFDSGEGTFTLKDTYHNITVWLHAPPGRQIVARLQIIRSYLCVAGCIYGGLELKWQADQTLTGSRFCCEGDVNTTLTSASNLMPIMSYNRYGAQFFSLSFQLV